MDISEYIDFNKIKYDPDLSKKNLNDLVGKSIRIFSWEPFVSKFDGPKLRIVGEIIETSEKFSLLTQSKAIVDQLNEVSEIRLRKGIKDDTLTCKVVKIDNYFKLFPKGNTDDNKSEGSEN